MLVGCTPTTITDTVTKTQTATTITSTTTEIQITTTTKTLPYPVTTTKTVINPPYTHSIPFIITDAITWTVTPDTTVTNCEDYSWQATIKNLSRLPKDAYIKVTHLDELGFVQGYSGRRVEFAAGEEKVVTGSGRHCSSQGISYSNMVLEVHDSKFW